MNETICDLEKKRIKLEHDLQVKDQHASCIESQLAHTKSLLETDSKNVGLLYYFNYIICVKAFKMVILSKTYMSDNDCVIGINKTFFFVLTAIKN